MHNFNEISVIVELWKLQRMMVVGCGGKSREFTSELANEINCSMTSGQPS